MPSYRIAAVQMDIQLGDVEANLSRMSEKLRETSRAGALLTVFPECAVPGYCFSSLEESLPYAQSVPGPATDRMVGVCRELKCFALFGMLERDGDQVFNVAVMVGPEGVVGHYRKIHLPFLGIDMFTTPGERPFAVQSAGPIRVGMNICYDAAFPETARCLALEGADLIALPTNWPPGAECTADCVINARAMENGVYYIAVNRVGVERGFTFIGRSKIVDPTGNPLAEAKTMGEEILYADIDPELARNKHVIRVPEKHEIDRLADRRPEMYGLLLEPHSLKRPGR
ncbi:MAG: carbon-nitrogen hydrolase family protein [Planctomycetota bacterium]